MSPARASLCAAAMALALAPRAPVFAAGSSADRDAAKALAGQAYDSFEAKNYRHAIDLFQKAEARFHAPPHLLYVGRAQVKLGLFLEAKATFERVADEKLPADAPGPFKEAQVSAKNELVEVAALTPSIVLVLATPVPPGARVELDGDPVALADLGKPVAKNPGVHALVAEAPGMMRVDRTIVLKVGGGEEHVDFALVPPPPSLVVPAIIAFSLGAAGLAAGTAGAVLLRSASPSKATGDRALAIAGFTAAGAGAAAGVVLLVLGQRAQAQAQAGTSAAAPRVGVGVGLGSVSVGGSF
jgi:tetratricopeptide (TPR) repeat protein